MNKDTIIKLLEDGAYFDALDSKFYHPSFRKGWRKMTSSNISWLAVKSFFYNSNRLVSSDAFVYTLTKTA
jgi:hypothetical protein